MFAPLNIKTDATLLTSLITVDKLIKYALNNNIKALTITDNSMFNAYEFYKKCKKNNILPIIGIDLKINDLNIILYARNYKGYLIIIKLKNEKLTNTISLLNCIDCAENLICIIPFTSLELYSDISKVIKYTFKSYENDEEHKNMEGNNLIYMSEIRYLEPSDKEYYKHLLAIKEGKKNKDIFTSDEYHLIVKEEKNNKLLTSLVDINFPKQQDLIPVFETPNNNSYEYLKELCLKGLRRIFGDRVKKVYIDRLKLELKIINEMNFNDYFLIVEDYVKYAKDNKILVGPGRGSAAGSLVSYCLNITTVDPIKYNLLFERFLNPERITMPDIDIDFEDERRDEVISYCINKYGSKRAMNIITFGTLAAKQTIRDVSKSLDIEPEKTNKIISYLDSFKDLITNYNTSEDLKEYLNKDKQLMYLYKVSLNLEGLKRHTSLHAAGMVISKKDIDEVIPINLINKTYTTSYSMDHLEEIGLLKMDFLGITNLTTIRKMINEINKDLNKTLTFENIPLIDESAQEIFRKGDTAGIFQFESSGMINFISKLKPDNFEEVVAAIALYRPGPMNNIPSFIARKFKEEEIDYIDDSLKEVLEETYGIIVYQEQILQVARIMANYSYAEADILRRSISDKNNELMDSIEKDFITKSINNNYSKEIATKVFKLIHKFAEYGFNKAHSVGYATVSYKMAYLKANYKPYFLKHLLNQSLENETKTKSYIYEARNSGIEILPPSINKSSTDYLIENNNLRYPLLGIKSIGKKTVETILNERKNGKFLDIFDFIKRIYGNNISYQTIIILNEAGCFDEFNLGKKTINENIDAIIDYGDLTTNLYENDILKPIIKQAEEYNNRELLELELKHLGIYLSNHPITGYRERTTNVIALKDLENYFDQHINTIVYIDNIKTIKTKAGSSMSFLTVSDEINKADVVLFPKTYERFKKIKKGSIILLNAKVEKRYDKYQLIANNIKRLE